MDQEPNRVVKEALSGILRSDLPKPNSLLPDCHFNQEKRLVSPQPSVDRLSVKFAHESPKMDSDNPKDSNMSDEEDYSVSVNAIIQRRASTKRSKKQRANSPFGGESSNQERRRSSVFTTSSGDTAITVDDNALNEVAQEEIFENIKLHKEVLSNVKMQPWNMRKKLRLVVQAKSYIKKHEGQLQERLAQSHSTKDMLARWNIVLIKKWQKWKRELTNMSMWFIPWELKIKEIESHFGSVVASYFIFLRWLFWVNIVIAVAIISFVTIPEIITADTARLSKTPDAIIDRKYVLTEEKYNSTNFLTLWNFEGVFKYSPLFYGWYSNRDYNDSAIFNTFNGSSSGYRLPFAYFITGLIVYAYSFVATLRKMAENSRMSKLSEKDDECIFSWKLFTAWDYMIGNAETAHNRVASIVMGFKEALLEEAEKKRESRKCVFTASPLESLNMAALVVYGFWKVICIRVLVNTLVLALHSCSAYAVVVVVARSNDEEANSTVWRQNEITVVMTLITFFFPMMFEVLGFAEQFHPRTQLMLQLARIMFLNLLNLYSLIFALFDKINDMTNTLQNIKHNISELITTDTPLTSTEQFQCLCPDFSPSTTPLTILNQLSEELVSASVAALVDSNATYWNDPTLPDNDTYLSEFDNMANQPSEADSLWWLLSAFSNSSASTAITTTWSSTTETTPTESVRFETDDTSTSSYCAQLCRNVLESTSTSSELEFRKKLNRLNYTMSSKLRNHCWETMFGQELIKLTVMDLFVCGISVLVMDFFRGLFVRYMNRCWCWDLEKKFPQYGDFKVAENILHLVNNQGMVWMGMFFSPGLVVLNVIKLYLLMYLRAWAVLTCNVPHEIIFRASRSNNFYYALLLLMLFLCVLPVGYAVVWIEPSWHCGPFSGYKKILHIFTKTIRTNLSPTMHTVLDVIVSPAIVIPLLLLLVLIIYYLLSLTGALREANNDLKIQLRRERTEERRKMFQLADRRRRAGSGGSCDQTPFSKWKKLLGNLPNNRSCDDTRLESDDIVPTQLEEENEEEKESKGKVFFTKLIKKALGKPQSTSEEEQATDTDQHESLPYDPKRHSGGEAHALQAIIHKWSTRRNSQKEMTETKTKEVSLEVTVHQVSSSRQDSASSTRSDHIPVITISTDNPHWESTDEDVDHLPRVKCMLKKQTEAIDEDMIGRFGRDWAEMEKDRQMIAEGSDKSTSEDTEVKEEDSDDTILNYPCEDVKM